MQDVVVAKSGKSVLSFKLTKMGPPLVSVFIQHDKYINILQANTNRVG